MEIMFWQRYNYDRQNATTWPALEKLGMYKTMAYSEVLHSALYSVIA